MIENTNQIGTATQELIFKRQIKDLLEEGLDDFRELTIDSTGVVANTAWPTEGKKGAKRKRRNLCDKLPRKGEKAVNALQKEFAKKARRIPVGNMLPSQIQQYGDCALDRKRHRLKPWKTRWFGANLGRRFNKGETE